MQKKNVRVNRFLQFIRFLRVSRLLLWTIWVIYRERRRVLRAREKGDYSVQPNVEVLIEVLVAFRQTALKLGVLMIKLGQFLSTRADLLPERAIAAISSLQDEVPAAPFSHVVYSIETELKRPIDEIFSYFERKATAAASLGQVHKATLATGEEVAVKIQRPNIEQLVKMDLSTLRFVIWVINRFVNTSDFIDLKGVYREFEQTVFEEIDYVREAANAQRFKEMFKDDPTIYIPTIYDSYTTRHVIIMEWIDGIKINDYPEIEARGMDRLVVATRTVQAYFYQFFTEGFFHADPHPGNIFVKRDSDAADPVIAFIDFGMVGRLTKTMKKSLTGLFLAVLGRDPRGLVSSLKDLGFIGEKANMAAIEKGLGLMMDQYFGITLGEARDLEISSVAQEIEELLYGQPFQIPAQFAFSGRAVSTLVGVATGLAPNFNFVDVATPYARKFLGLDAESAGQTIQQVLQQVLESGRLLLSLPRSLERIVNKLEAGQIEVRVAPSLPTTRNGRGGRRRNGNGGAVQVAGPGLALPIMFLASMGGGIYLTSIHQTMTGWFCLGLSGVIALIGMIRR